MIDDLAWTWMQFQFLDKDILISLDVEGKKCLFVDGNVVIEEIAGDCLSEDLVDDEEVADIEVDLFNCVVVGLQ